MINKNTDEIETLLSNTLENDTIEQIEQIEPVEDTSLNYITDTMEDSTAKEFVKLVNTRHNQENH